VFDIPQGLPILQTDGEKLADAIVKLVENGLRYSPEGEGQVVVSAEGDNGTLLIHVSDNGVGMNDAEVARLGEMFWRADNDLVRSYKGSGLGIPIAFGLIDLMGGKIDVSSQPDEGTTFTIAIEGMS
jgi:cell cycle sensor histidine kinase DivJ